MLRLFFRRLHFANRSSRGTAERITSRAISRRGRRRWQATVAGDDVARFLVAPFGGADDDVVS